MPDPVHTTTGPDLDGLLHRIKALAKVGVAASDSLMNVEIGEDEHQAIYETIAGLAQEAAQLAGDNSQRSHSGGQDGG